MLEKIAKYGKLIGIVLFAVIIANIDWKKMLALLGKVDPVLFIFAVGLFPLFVLLKALRWNILLKGQGVDYPLKSCFIVYLSSNFLGVLTPGRVGEMSKVFYLKQERNLSFTRGISNVLLDRLFDLLILAVVASIGVFSFYRAYRISVVLMLMVIAIAIALIACNISRLDAGLKKILYRMDHRKTYRRLKVFFLSFASLNMRYLTYSFLVSLLGIALYFVICNLLALSLHFNSGIFLIPFSISIANIISLIPISVSGIGLRDLVLIIVLGNAGFSPEAALSFSILFLFYFTGLWALLGWIAWNIKPVSYRKDTLKEEAPETGEKK